MGKIDLDLMRRKREEMSKGGGGGNYEFDKLESGKNVRRVLFPKGTSKTYFEEGFLHFGLGENGKTVATCPQTFDIWESNEEVGKDGKKVKRVKKPARKCPICEEVARLKASKDKEDKKLADKLKATKRIYVNVINREEEEEKVMVLPIGVTICKALLDFVCDPDYGDVTDYTEGRDVTITKTGKGLSTEYTVIPKPKASLASEEMSEEELDEKMVDLKSLFSEKSYEELEALLNGEEYDDSDDSDDSDDEDDEDDEDDDSDDDEGLYDELELKELEKLCKKRKIKLPAKPSKLKLIALLEDYDENSDEEEAKPSKVKKNHKQADESEDEDDDEDDDDDDDSDDDDEEDEDDEDDEEEKITKKKSQDKAISDISSALQERLNKNKKKK